MNPRWLAPLAPVFGAAVSARNAVFDTGLFSGPKYPVKIVSIGNLSVGGTGKTPVTAHMLRALRGLGKKACVVSRGYGGTYQQRAARVDLKVQNAAQVFGDEPTWLAKSLEVPVFVGRRRRAAVEMCLAEEKPDIILADDAFQHRWLRRDRDIVLLDAQDMAIELLPRGRFREPLSSLRRADFVILTKSNLVGNDELDEWASLLREQGFAFGRGNLFRAPYALGEIEPQRGAEPLREGQPVLMASAIAQPGVFEELVAPRNPVKAHLIRPDHHYWFRRDVIELTTIAERHKINSVVVTEKDFIKLQHVDWGSLQLHVARLAIEIEPEFPYAKLLE